jgi:HTH-type transcriptional regulator, quorum sensing regulator NprR
MDTLGRKIRTLRRKQKLTQQELADGVVTASMISQIESDRATPSAALLEHIASRLQVSITAFQTNLSDKSDELTNYRKARHLIESGQFEEALTILNSLSWPLSPQFKPEVVYSEMATCYLKLGRYEDASKMYESMIQVAFEKDDIAAVVHGYFNVGSTLKRVNRDKVARMYWQRASDLLKKHADMYMPVALKIYFNLGRLYLDEGQWILSRDSYQQALLLSNRYGGNLDLAKTYHGLACACMQLQEFEEAFMYNERAIAAHVAADNQRGTLKCRINHGVILRFAGRLEEANHYFTSVRSLIPEREPSLKLALEHECALLAWQLNDFERVLEESARALSHERVNLTVQIELRLVRAKTYLELEDPEASLKEVDLLNELSSDLHSEFRREVRNVQRACWLLLGEEYRTIHSCMSEATEVLIGVHGSPGPTRMTASDTSNISA